MIITIRKMRLGARAVAAIALLLTSCAGGPPLARPASPDGSALSASMTTCTAAAVESARETIAHFEDSWNRHDSDRLAGLFEQSGWLQILRSPAGALEANGRVQIRAGIVPIWTKVPALRSTGTIVNAGDPGSSKLLGVVDGLTATLADGASAAVPYNKLTYDCGQRLFERVILDIAAP